MSKLSLNIEPNKDSDLFHENLKVRFSISNAFGTKYCISNLSKPDWKGICKSFSKYESYKWGEFKTLNGIGYKTEKNPKELMQMFPNFSRFAHFRVKDTESDLFRIFGAEADNMFYILWFDRKGTQQTH